MPRLRHAAPVFRRAMLAALVTLMSLISPLPTYAASPEAAPSLTLPTPPGEPWKIIQGYACGTHNTWDRYSLDLVSAGGKTAGAPVRAAADGVVFVWVKKSGTLILHHGGGFYTMYTHMASAVNTREGTFFGRGAQVGTVGERGSPGLPHLHFTAFTAEGAWARNRRSVALSFAEGYQLPEGRGCSQHQGTVLVASEALSAMPAQDTTPPQLGVLKEPIQAVAGEAVELAWPAAIDDASGVAGYRLYIGPDQNGMSDWFVPAPQVELPSLGAGAYLLRVQPLDTAGNAGAWVTMAEILVA
jgi:hypothetical protein